MKNIIVMLIMIISAQLHAESVQQSIARVCTQNLNNYSLPGQKKKRGKKTLKQLQEQKQLLISRWVENNCDVIAVQEIISQDWEDAAHVLKTLAMELSEYTNHLYTVLSAKSNDTFAKLGYIINESKFDLQFNRSYADQELPKLTKYDKKRLFSRGPLRIDLKHKNGQEITLFNIHFKSSASYHKYDSAGFQFEIDRMQMAQKLKEIVREVKRNNPGNMILVLGDRNSQFGSASDRILRGEIDFDFFSKKLCHVLENKEAECPAHMTNRGSLVGIINEDPDIKLQKTYANFKRQLIDDILISREDAAYVLELNSEEKDYDVGMIPPAKPLIDHPMLWVDLHL